MSNIYFIATFNTKFYPQNLTVPQAILHGIATKINTTVCPIQAVVNHDQINTVCCNAIWNGL